MTLTLQVGSVVLFSLTLWEEQDMPSIEVQHECQDDTTRYLRGEE